MGACNASAHDAGPQHADLLYGPRLHRGIGHAAAQMIRTEVEQCKGISDAERTHSPFAHKKAIAEIVPHREFYDYAAKYLEEGTQLLIPAKLKTAQLKKIQKIAVDAFRALELSGMARVDFFLEKKGGKIYLNEVNTIPGFTSISMYPKLWEASGIPFRDLIDRLIELALDQHAEKARTKYQIELPEGAAGALEA